MTYAAKCRYCNVAPVVERAPAPPKCGEPDILGFHEDYLGLGHFDRYVFYRRGRP
jgi:hypothetical protein